MTRLLIDVLDAQPAPTTASPAITLRLRITELGGGRVHAIALRCHVRIEPRSGRYSREEQSRLYELFGHVSQWDRTLRGVTWAQPSIMVPSFEGRIDVDFPIPCTYDLQVASAKYFHAVRDGEIPLVLLFSGTIFRADEAGRAHEAGRPNPGGSAPALMIEPVSWDLEAAYRMPAAVWRAAMDRFFPGGGWLRLDRDTIERLQAFRARHAVVTWDDAIALLLQYAEQEEIA